MCVNEVMLMGKTYHELIEDRIRWFISDFPYKLKNLLGVG